MEHYVVSPEGIKKVESLGQISGNVFTLSLFPLGEWDLLDRQLAYLGSAGLTKILAKLKSAEDTFNPHFERLSPSLVYICYSDFDPDGKDVAVRFFLSFHHITIMENDRVNLQQVTDWVQRGLLKTAPDLAQLLGMEMVEHYQQRLEQFEDQMDSIEEGILDSPRKWQMIEINALHKQIIGLKKLLNAHETIFGKLAAMDKSYNGNSSWQELVTETQRELENARQTHELVISLREAYQMSIDNSANDIMKVLTLLATLLLPLNLITSFYGMNFEYMPLIHSPYGMPFFYLVSILIISGVLLLFWRKRWLK